MVNNLQKMFYLISDGYLQLSSTLDIKAVNLSLCHALRYKQEELLGKSIINFTADNLWQTIIDLTSQLDDYQGPSLEISLRKKSGELCIYQILSGISIADSEENEQCVGLLLTENRRRSQLNESFQRLRRHLDMFDMGSASADLQELAGILHISL